MKKLFLLLCFLSFASIVSAQWCSSNDFDIKGPNFGGGQINPCDFLGPDINIEMCYTNDPTRYYLTPKNDQLTIKEPSGTINTLIKYTDYHFKTTGNYELNNTITQIKKVIKISTAIPANAIFIDILENRLNTDTLKYCRQEANFYPRFFIAGGPSPCPNSDYSLDNLPGFSLKVNNILKAPNSGQVYVPRINGAYNLNLDSLKNGDKIQFVFNGPGFNSNSFCGSCFAPFNNLTTRPFTLKIIENEILPLPVATGTPMCAGDTTTLTRNESFKKVKWGDIIYNTDTTIIRKELNPTKAYLKSQTERPNGCYAISNPIIVESKNCGYRMIRGYVYQDNNSNSTYDPKFDIAFPNVKVSFVNNGISTFTNSKGFYEFKTDTFKLFKYYSFYISDPEYFSNSSYANFGSNIYYQDKSMTSGKVLNSDLNLQATSGRSRPGFTIPLYFNIYNQGKKTNGGVLTVSLDNAYTYSSASKAPKSINGKTLTFDVDSMESGRLQTITVYATLSTISPLGSTLSSSANLITTKLDDNTVNNNFTLTSTVVGSFDPNDIEVSPKGTGPTGIIADTSKLDYTIRFQNLGTDTAFTVVVKNKLPNGVDFNQFKMLGASHNYQLSVQGTDTIVWTFNNILLPDNKKNEPKSHGFIRYKINQKPKNASGTEIRNEAKVYFDFNVPVATNQVLNTVNPITTGLEFADALSGFQLYPNPSEGLLNVVSPIAGKLVLSNIMGQSVFQSQIGKEEKLDITALEKGLYIFTFETLEGKKSGKLLIR